SSTTPDAVVMLFSARLAPDIAIFAFLHLVLLRLKINGRSAYACAGGVAAVTGYMLSYALGYPFGRPVSGAILSSVLPLFGLGALCGFLYLRIAGYAGGRPALSAGAPEAMQACDTPSAFD